MRVRDGDIVELQTGAVVQLTGYWNGCWHYRTCDPGTLARDEGAEPRPLDVPVKRVLERAETTSKQTAGDYDPVKGER